MIGRDLHDVENFHRHPYVRRTYDLTCLLQLVVRTTCSHLNRISEPLVSELPGLTTILSKTETKYKSNFFFTMVGDVNNDALLSVDSQHSFQFLKCLPPEILRRILYRFCDGKALSTLSLALLSASSSSKSEQFYRSIALLEVPRVCRNRLNDIASTIEEKTQGILDSNASRAQIVGSAGGAVEWIRSIATALDDTHDDNEASSTIVLASPPPLSRMKILSENAAVLDYLIVSLRDYSNIEKGQFEWPVWCGQLTIDSFLTGSRMRNSGRVLISSPMQRPSYIPGCNLLTNHSPAGLFRCEPYNIVPRPPWGKIHGLEREDNHVLRPVADRLIGTDQVAVPTGYYGRNDMLDIRILAPLQARRLLSSRMRGILLHSSSLSSSWMLEEEEEQQQHDGDDDDDIAAPLVCCWQGEEGDLDHDRDYIDYIIDLLKVRERLLTRRVDKAVVS